MRKLTVLLLLAGMALPAFAAKDIPTTKVTIAQLEQALAAAHGKPDADLAQQLSGMELTERLSAPRLARLNADLSGERARQALVILADSAAFLDLPAVEIPADTPPDPATARRMLTAIVDYVNKTVPQLPNLIAVRDTTRFEDQPQEDQLGRTGITSLAAMPLHSVGNFNLTVTYRDHKEVVDEKALKHAPKTGGLVTAGEFGPLLGRVVGDALAGKITWAVGSGAWAGKRLFFTTRSPARSRTITCSSVASLKGIMPTALRIPAYSAKTTPITGRLPSIHRVERFCASRWRPKCQSADSSPGPIFWSSTARRVLRGKAIYARREVSPSCRRIRRSRPGRIPDRITRARQRPI